MYLYRVEHKTDRTGPYHAALCGAHLYWTDTHPNPMDEGLDFHYGDHCGFESKAKLLNWFQLSDLKEFSEYGFNVYKIHVEWVEKGDKQLIFDPATTYFRKKIELKDLRQFQRRICPFSNSREDLMDG